MRAFAILALSTLLALATPALAQGDGGPPSITLVAQNQDCPDDRTYCFGATDEALLELQPGATVEVTLVNRGGSQHNLFIAGGSKGDPDHRSSEREQALAGTRPEVPPGGEDTFQITVPEGTQELYLWCDIVGHERLGMWVVVDLAAGTVEGNAPPLAKGEARAPLPPLLGAVILTLVAAAARPP